MEGSQERAWHQALAYAVTGRLVDGLGRQQHPDPVTLASVLRQRSVPLAPVDHACPVPPELMAGLGAAQFVAALSQLRAELAPRPPVPAVVANRPLTVDERRLLSDVPPHHGS